MSRNKVPKKPSKSGKQNNSTSNQKKKNKQRTCPKCLLKYYSKCFRQGEESKKIEEIILDPMFKVVEYYNALNGDESNSENAIIAVFYVTNYHLGSTAFFNALAQFIIEEQKKTDAQDMTSKNKRQRLKVKLVNLTKDDDKKSFDEACKKMARKSISSDKQKKLAKKYLHSLQKPKRYTVLLVDHIDERLIELYSENIVELSQINKIRKIWLEAICDYNDYNKYRYCTATLLMKSGIDLNNKKNIITTNKTETVEHRPLSDLRELSVRKYWRGAEEEQYQIAFFNKVRKTCLDKIKNKKESDIFGCEFLQVPCRFRINGSIKPEIINLNVETCDQHPWLLVMSFKHAIEKDVNSQNAKCDQKDLDARVKAYYTGTGRNSTLFSDFLYGLPIFISYNCEGRFQLLNNCDNKKIISLENGSFKNILEKIYIQFVEYKVKEGNFETTDEEFKKWYNSGNVIGKFSKEINECGMHQFNDPDFIWRVYNEFSLIISSATEEVRKDEKKRRLHPFFVYLYSNQHIFDRAPKSDDNNKINNDVSKLT